ncbi:Agamous-like MADS-box protein [Arachis hypogaea]|nr:Agamous-like MADS-box protein [Arachis hypogaea]
MELPNQAPEEGSSQHHQKKMGRGKIEIKRIETLPTAKSRSVSAATACSRKLMSSPSSVTPRSPSSSSPAAAASTSTPTTVLEELSKGIRKQVLLPQTQNLYLKLIHRHILGEALSSLSLKELKNLESRLQKGLSRVRSRKHETLFADVEFMQKREIELQNHNNYLRAKIAEHERAQQQQQQEQEQQNLMHGNMCEDQSTIASQTYDRNFFPVNLLDSNNHQYSRQDHTALQLV